MRGGITRGAGAGTGGPPAARTEPHWVTLTLTVTALGHTHTDGKMALPSVRDTRC